MTSIFDIEVAARTLCQEARGEPLEGQEAVAWVIKNRAASSRWGRSISSVCLWPYQFSGWNGPKDPNFTYACRLPDTDPTLAKMRDIFLGVMKAKEDPTRGALHYVNLSVVVPPWTKGATKTVKIGAHTFFKDVP